MICRKEERDHHWWLALLTQMITPLISLQTIYSWLNVKKKKGNKLVVKRYVFIYFILAQVCLV